MKNETETIVGSWLLWLAGAAAKLLPLIQFLSFTAALVLSCIGIYKFFKHGEKK
jgi:phosphoglycerol transferase MdoB-like AlkP superfamily enzyme